MNNSDYLNNKLRLGSIYRIGNRVYLLFFFSVMGFCQQESRTSFLLERARMVNPAWQNGLNTTTLGFTVEGVGKGESDVPLNQSIFFNTNVGVNTGMGLVVNNSHSPLGRATTLGVDVDYAISFDKDVRLFLGFRAGGSFYKNKNGDVSSGTEAVNKALFNSSRFNANIGAGLHFQAGSYFLGFAVPAILADNRLVNEEGVVVQGRRNPYYFSMGGRTFLYGKWFLNSAVEFRYVSRKSLTESISLLLDYNKAFSFGGNYDDDGVFSGIGIYHFSRFYTRVGYSYRFNTSKVANDNFSLNHELMFIISLP